MRIGLSSPYFGSVFGGGERYLGATAAVLRDAYPEARVEVVSSVPVNAAEYERRLALDLHGIEFSSTNRQVTRAHHLLNSIVPLRPLRAVVLSRQAERASARYDVHLAQAYRIPVRTGARHAGVLVQFPYRDPAGIERFQLVVAQSEYVREWVRRYWDRDALVVPPPVDVPEAEPNFKVKERSILTVGRFFAGGHSKRHDAMVAAFRDLCDSGLEGWTLHLAGAAHRAGPHRGLLEHIEASARGYPIRIHVDVPRQVLDDLYRRAAIYWHAAGFGLDAGADPEQYEHFGLSPAEAMARGAVPVVFDGGGLPEVVRDGEGVRWRTIKQLREETLRLIADEPLRHRLAVAARGGVKRFAGAAFREHMEATLRPLLTDAGAGGREAGAG